MSMIRFREEDKLNLQKAIYKFNRNVRKLRREENLTNVYLPETIKYKDIREDIITRKEFNRVINALNTFSKKKNQKIVELPSGMNITLWERKQITYAKRRATRSLNLKMSGIQTVAGLMGSAEIEQIKSTLESFENLENKKGYEYKMGRERLFNVGSFDYDLKKANIYRENFMLALEEMKDYDNYNLLKERLDKIKNPKEFFEFVNQSNEISDLFLYYKDKATAQTYGGFASNQDAFNAGIQKLGISGIEY